MRLPLLLPVPCDLAQHEGQTRVRPWRALPGDWCAFLPRSCMFEPEGNACSLTDSTAEEHVLALVEHAADEARDRINRLVPGGKVASPAGGTAIRVERLAGRCEHLVRAPPVSQRCPHHRRGRGDATGGPLEGGRVCGVWVPPAEGFTSLAGRRPGPPSPWVLTSLCGPVVACGSEPGVTGVSPTIRRAPPLRHESI